MVRLARLLLIPIGLALAFLAFVHAASENSSLLFRPGSFGHSGIDAYAMGRLADRGFRAEMVAARTAAIRGTIDGVSPEELAELAKNPAALERFLEDRQATASGDIANEYPKISDELLAIAQLAYAAEPLDTRALRTIALGDMLHENPERARRALRLAGRLNKRDDITNLWLAQDYGRLGDVENMLTSFDHALRTSGRAREAAIRPIVGLIGSEQSQVILGGLLSQNPEWERAFWSEFSRNPVALANAGAFFKNSGMSVEQMPEGSRRALYTNLKRTVHFDVLFQLAALDTATAAGTNALAAGKFIVADDDNPLGWALHSRGEFAAWVHQTTEELQIDARAGSFGVAADRVVVGGRDYRMIIRMAEAVPNSAEVTLTAVCADESKRDLAKIVLSAGKEGGAVPVPARGCDYVALELSFEAAPGRNNPLIRVDSIELVPG